MIHHWSLDLSVLHQGMREQNHHKFYDEKGIGCLHASIQLSSNDHHRMLHRSGVHSSIERQQVRVSHPSPLYPSNHHPVIQGSKLYPTVIRSTEMQRILHLSSLADVRVAIYPFSHVRSTPSDLSHPLMYFCAGVKRQRSQMCCAGMVFE